MEHEKREEKEPREEEREWWWGECRGKIGKREKMLHSVSEFWSAFGISLILKRVRYI